MKQKIYVGLIALSFNSIAQTPTGSPPAYAGNPNQAVVNSNFAWYRGGNNLGGQAGANNIFGTMWNSPIYMQTAGQQRMVLMGQNPAGSISGALGLGTTSPQSYMHINSAGTNNANGLLFRTDGGSNILNQWQFFTGGLEKFKLFIPAGSTNAGLDAGLQSTSAQMFFNTATTNGAAPGGVAERMRLSYGVGGNLAGGFNRPGVTKVLISHDGFGAGYLPPAVAMLNIGSSTPNPSAGNRPWMDVGTYYSMHTDNMYVGLKDEGGPNRVSSVINWGDDPAGTNSNNRLLYLFTGFGGQGESSTTDGLEVGRMWASANAGRMGIGGDPTINRYFGNSIDPNNTLEVNPPDSFLVGAVGKSGLRFTDLRSKSLPQPSQGPGVLSLDSLGDVIYVPSSGLGFGNLCSASAQNPLTGHYEIPLAQYDFFYSGQGNLRTNVGIGLPCATQLGGKLHVYQTANNMMLSTTLGQSIAGRFDNYAGGPNTYLAYGVVGNAQGTGTTFNVGVFGQAANATGGNFAGYFQGNVYITGTTTGVGAGSFSDKNIKTNINSIGKSMDVINKLRPVNYQYDNAYAPQLNLNNHKNYGFIAQEVESILPDLVSTSTVIATYDNLGNIIIPEKVIKALNYDGIIPFAIGGIQELYVKQQQMQAQIDKAGLSDAQVKTNITTFNALAKVKVLNPVSYNFTNANVPQLTFKSNLEYGFVAQQLETVYPELVDTVNVPASYDSLGNVVNAAKTLKSVNYKAMTALLARSIQEQQSTIDSLKTRLSKQDSINQSVQQQLTNLSNLINSCCSNNSRTSNNSIQNQLDVELSDKDVIVLNQNVPNPFAEQTTITYNVPQSVAKAQLIFYNSAGQIIQTVDIKTRGKGKVNVFASDLSAGLYHYTLVADGKVVDSKKMIRE